MLAWQVSYEGHGLIVGGKSVNFSAFGFVMAKDLHDIDRQVIRVAKQHPVIAQHEGDQSSLVFNAQEVYERPDLGTLETEELEIELELP